MPASSWPRRDSSSASRDLGRLYNRGSRAELRERWKRMVKIRKAIMRIKGPMAVAMAKSPMRQISER